MDYIIEPTGKCFDDALSFLELFRLDDPAIREDIMRTVRIAHGICAVPAGVAFAHAWVEERVINDPDRPRWPARVVWQGMRHQSGLPAYFAVDAEWFMQAYGVRERTLYTPRECAMWNLRTGHYGPWIARYRLLAGSSRVLGEIQNARVLGVLEHSGISRSNGST